MLLNAENASNHLCKFRFSGLGLPGLERYEPVDSNPGGSVSATTIWECVDGIPRSGSTGSQLQGKALDPVQPDLQFAFHSQIYEFCSITLQLRPSS